MNGLNVSWRRIWLWSFLFWTTIGLLAASQDVVSSLIDGRPRPTAGRIAVIVSGWWYWALVTPSLVWLIRRFRMDEIGWWRFFAIHAFVSIAVTAGELSTILPELLFRDWRPPEALGWIGTAQLIVLSRIVPDTLVYLAILGTASALEYYVSLRKRELRTSQLETQLAEARVAVLRAQLNPHFLFNTLNTVAGQIRVERGGAALRMLDRLGEMLRHALDHAQDAESPLESELQLLTCYTDIEKERFGNRLRVVLKVQPGVEKARVPTLLLQPLVENAIRHGISAREDGGTVTVSARRRGNRFRIGVKDDGAGIADPRTRGPAEVGIGLANTMARLKNLYGDGASMSVGSVEPSGTEVIIDLPFNHLSDG